MAADLSAPRTVAIALDSAEPAVVRGLMAAGEMPVLAAVEARGAWARVPSSAGVGSGSVWPTFASGTDVHEHGTHFIWRWDPQRMRLGRETGDGVVPWWRRVANEGRRVLTLDVPYIASAGADNCVEVLEWGSHDRRLGRMQTQPPELRAELARDPGAHPFQRDRPPRHDDPSRRDLARAAAAARTGARLRGPLAARLIEEVKPDLSLIVFSELHHSSHLLWQSVAPDDPLFAGRTLPRVDERALIEVFRATDAAVGTILESAGDDARVVVFSLHGMRSSFGIPTLLVPLLADLGYLAAPRPARMSPGDAARTAFAAAKRGAPEWARSAWRRNASLGALNAVAGPTAMRAFHWDRTRAFVLPHDQHGWIRINLAGREARGIVPAAHYVGTCDELSAALLAARTVDGRPLVKRVLRTADAIGGRPPRSLADLVVHWDDAAYDDPVSVAGTGIVLRPDARRLTGRHTFEGFLLTAGMAPPGAVVAGHDLHRVIAGS